MESIQAKQWLAFISYSHVDIKWAEWLQQKLEFYKLPNFVAEEYPDKPKQLRPIFRDVTDLEAGILPEKITQALHESKYLIAICSPNASASEWVDKEIREFIQIGKERNEANEKRIIPFIIDGEAHAKDPKKECLPPALLSLHNDKEVVGPNISELGQDYAAVKVVAALLELKVDKLWQRYLEAEEKEKQRMLRERNRLLKVQSLYLSERSLSLTDNYNTDVAKLLALEALPKQLDEPDRPYVLDADAALRQASYSYRRILKGHKAEIKRLLYSPDGKYLFSSSWRGTIVWDCHTGLQLETFDKAEIYFSTDGELFLHVKGYVVEIWRYSPREMISKIECVLYLKRTRDSKIKGASFSNDHSLLALVVFEHFDETKEFQTYYLRIYDTASGKKTHNFIYEGSYYHQKMIPVISPDNRLIAVANANVIKIWDLETGNNLHDLTGHLDVINKISFSPDGSLLASCSFETEQCIKLWDIKTGELAKTLAGHEKSVYSVHFDAEGERLVSASADGTVRLWDISSGKCDVTIDISSSAIYDAIFSPDGNNIAAGLEDRNIYIASLNFGCLYTILGNRPYLIEMGKQLVTMRDPHRNFCYNIMTYDTGTGRMNRISNISEAGYLETLSHDGRYAVFSHRRGKNTWEYTLRDTENFDIIRVLGPGQLMRGVAFSPDDRQFVSVGPQIMIGQTETGNITTFLNDSSNKYGILLSGSPNGSYMDYGNARFSKDGRYIIYHDSNTIDIWDIQNKKIIWSNNDNRMGTQSEFCYDFHPESMRLVTKNYGDITIWDISKNQLLHTFNAHVGDILALAFSPDGKLIVSAGEDQGIYLWDVETGNFFLWLDLSSLLILDGDEAKPEQIMFSPDGHRIICSSKIGSTIVWDFPPLQELIDKTRERFQKRPLTTKERQKYYLE